jgi:hypothetical protein
VPCGSVYSAVHIVDVQDLIRNRGADHRRRTLPPTSDHFICANLRKARVRPVLFLRRRRRFPHARSVPLLQTKMFGFDALTSIGLEAVRAIRQRISEYQNGVKQPICQNEIVRMNSDPLAKSLKRLELVKGIEPSYSAWKSPDFPMFTRAILTFSSFLGD